MPDSSQSAQSSLPTQKRLYLIDGYSNIFRAFYAIRNLSNSKGEPTNAVYGFLQMLRKLLRDESPELVGVALDVSSDTVRKEAFEDYKANRAPMPDDLKPQIPWIRRVIEAHQIPILEMPRYEADDVLGTLAAKASEAGFHVYLVSADKDLMQLVGPQVSLFHTGRNKIYDPALVEEDFGVPPSQVVEVLALMGDASDNVPGVPGIGEKGAKTLVKEYGSVEALLDKADEIKRKGYREGLQNNREQALLSKELVTIHCDLPIDFDADALHHDPPDAEALKDLFRELEFFSLLEELESSEEKGSEATPAEPVADADEWRQATASITGELVVAAIPEEAPIGLAVQVEDRVVLADFRTSGVREAALESLAGWVASPAIRLRGHHLKEILRLLPAESCPSSDSLATRLDDAMLMSYLLRSAARSHGFDEIVLDRLNRTVLSEKDSGWTKSEAPMPNDPALLTFAGERAAYAGDLVDRLGTELESRADLESVYRTIEAPLVPVLLAMEERGIELDTDFLAEMSMQLEKDIAALEGDIHEAAGETFTIGSPKQLGVVLFEKLGYPVLKRTRKTKSYSTDAETLEGLAARGYPIAEKVTSWRELTKLKSTYVDALPTLVADDGRIHTRFNQAVAATGRLSSANPNLQNIPIRTEIGQRIRKAFVARTGCRLLTADYSQVELRVLAHIAEEPALIEAFAAGEDIHRSTAATVFGISSDLVNSEQRRAAKTINFGIIYGISAFGLAANLGIPQPEAQRFIDGYLDRYDGVKRYMDETLAAVKDTGRVETLYGRVREIPDIRSKNRNIRENAKRMAINARIQGTAADLMKLAMIRVDRRLRDEHPESNLLLTVHDELVLEVPDDRIEAVSTLVRDEMEGVADLKVPLSVDLGSGKTWYDAKD